MLMTKLKTGASVLLAVAVLGAGAGLAAHQVPKGTKKESSTDKEAQAAESVQPAEETKAGTDRQGDPLPPGAVERLGTTRLRTTARALMVAPDGRTLFTAAGGRTIGRWDPETGRLRDEIHLKRPWEERCWFAPDGRIIAVPEAEGIGLWELATGERKRLIAVNDKSLMTLAAFSRGGETLATAEYVSGKNGNGTGYVRVWPTGEHGKGKLIAELPSYANALAFSPDGGRLYAAVDNHSLRCWDVATAKELWKNDHWARHVVVAPDGKSLCTDTYQEGPLQLWNAETGRTLGTIESGRSWTNQIAFAPDGKTVAQGTSKGVLLWDVATLKLQHRLEPAGWHFTFAADGRSLFTLGNMLERWDVRTGKRLYTDTRADGHVGSVQAVTFAPDGRSVATRGVDGTVRVWELAGGRHRVLGVKASFGLGPLTLTKDGRLLLTDEEAGALVLLNVETGREIRRFLLPQKNDCRTDVAAVRITPDGRTLLALGSTQEPPTNTIHFEQEEPLRGWDVATGKEILTRTIPCSMIAGAEFSPDGRFVVRRGYPELRDVRTGTCRPLVEAPNYINSPVAFSLDGRFLALGEPGEDKEWLLTKGVCIYEVLTGRQRSHAEAALGNCGALAFSPDGRLFAAPGIDALYVWETSTGRRLMHLPVRDRLTNWTGVRFAECLAFAPDGKTLATGHADGTVLVWDLTPAWKKVSVPKGPVDAAACWKDLSAADPRTAWKALEQLAADPPAAMRLLGKQLRPEKIEAQWLADRLADLESDAYDTREAATRELKRVAEAVEADLQKAREKTTSAEVRRRLADILEAPRAAVPPADALCKLRAVAILERIGSDEAKELLQTLAEGASGAPLTREAKEALRRLPEK